jgi:hypothetical protein
MSTSKMTGYDEACIGMPRSDENPDDVIQVEIREPERYDRVVDEWMKTSQITNERGVKEMLYVSMEEEAEGQWSARMGGESFLVMTIFFWFEAASWSRIRYYSDGNETASERRQALIL